MSKRKFIKVKTLENGFHVIRVSCIRSIKPRKKDILKTCISMRKSDHEFYSTETEEEILKKIEEVTSKKSELLFNEIQIKAQILSSNDSLEQNLDELGRFVAEKLGYIEKRKCGY